MRILCFITMFMVISPHARTEPIEDELFYTRMAVEDVEAQLMVQNQGKTQPRPSNDAKTASADDLLATYRKEHAGERDRANECIAKISETRKVTRLEIEACDKSASRSSN